MTREHINRAELVEARFLRLQEGLGAENQLTILYAQGPRGIYTLERDVVQGEGGTLTLRHIMTLIESEDSSVKQAVMEDGNVTRVSGYGYLTEDERGIYAQGLFHALRYYDFTPEKPGEKNM